MDTRVPYFDGQRDFLAFARFLDNREEYAGYMKKLDERVAKLLDAAKLYGKAKDIEKKHEVAELWAKRAESDYGERGKKLAASEKSLAKEFREGHAKLKERETKVETLLREGNKALKVREAGMKALEDEVGGRERAAVKMEAAAQKKSEAAIAAKREADDMVKRMQVAVTPAA